MSRRVRKHAALLQWLKTAKPATAKAVIKAADKELINTICECCLNVLKGNVPLTSQQKKKLAVHKSTLRTLAQKKVSLHRKKRALTQRGGALLGALAAPIIGLLGTLLGSR